MTRHLVTLATGEEFRFVTADRAKRFAARNPGSVYHGAQSVPVRAMPPALAAMFKLED